MNLSADANDSRPIIAGTLREWQQRALAAEALAAELQAERDELRAKIAKMAEAAYREDVIYTGMEDDMIGEGKEYADKADWIESWIAGFDDD